jgi:hypothetical protein
MPERAEPPNDPIDERAALEDRLEFQRTTLLLKCGGLTPEQLALRSVPPSTRSTRATMATRISSANASTAPRANSHDRSPLVTPPQILDDWLDPNTTETHDVQALLDSVPPPVLVPTPVSTDVNSLSNNNPSLTKPVEESGDATSDHSTTMKGKKALPGRRTAPPPDVHRRPHPATRAPADRVRRQGPAALTSQ